MKHLGFLAFLVLGLVGATAQAAEPPNPVYKITDIAVDVTADSAAKAKDQAISQAQRNALDQLMDKIHADRKATEKLSANDIATLVQNYEVQKESGSGVKYVGTFTVQFRPGAVRRYLTKQGVAFDDKPPVAADAAATPPENEAPAVESGDPSIAAALPLADGAATLLPVAVPLRSVAEWASMQRRLKATAGVRGVDVITMERGLARIDLGIDGDLDSIRSALMDKNLRLTQDAMTGEWTLKSF